MTTTDTDVEGLVRKDAMISDCGQYRYRLIRHWRPRRPAVLFIMLNPSTADAAIDDPTIRSCMRLARHWRYGGIEVVNLFAWRATDPGDLKRACDPIGPANDEHIEDALSHTDFTICAWGANKLAERRSQKVLGMIERHGRAHCLEVTKSGAPKHPLYVKTETTPQLWPALRARASQ